MYRSAKGVRQAKSERSSHSRLVARLGDAWDGKFYVANWSLHDFNIVAVKADWPDLRRLCARTPAA
jgi:hypothetical protein